MKKIFKTILFLGIHLLFITTGIASNNISLSNMNHPIPLPQDTNRITIYLLAGLGLDPAIFKHLTINATNLYYLHWIEPLKKESLDSYAQRMAKGISPTKETLILIGHSFGGVLMQEISKYVPAKKIILISSIKKKKEKNAGMNFWMRVFPFHQLVTQKMVVNSFKSWGPKHGYKSPDAQEVFRNAAKKHSSYYFKWATSRICEWESKAVTTPIVHIHGTKDKTFPYKRITAPVIAVKDGSHLMVFNKATEISQLINKELQLSN